MAALPAPVSTDPTTMTSPTERKTALHDQHVALGAKMVPFAGYRMPLSYQGQLVEHRAVRDDLGLFDLSHMGEFRLTGDGALAAVDHLVTNRILGTDPGQVVYSPLCRDDGTVIDDLLVYHQPDSVLLVVNASNIDKDREWILDHLPAGVTLTDESYETSLLAVQGPNAEPFLAALTSADLAGLGYYRATDATVAGIPVLLSRTGYTGEDGFELYVEDGSAPSLWEALTQAGGDRLVPVGLAARDTLRFEVGYCLYGNDLDDTTTPLEAGLGWTVKLDKDDFIGQEALARQKADKPSRRLVGLEPEGARTVPRAGYEVRHQDETVGRVTSGTFAPSLERGLAMAYVAAPHAKKGTRLSVDIRGRSVGATVVRPPFYKDGSRRTD